MRRCPFNRPPLPDHYARVGRVGAAPSAQGRRPGITRCTYLHVWRVRDAPRTLYRGSHRTGGTEDREGSVHAAPICTGWDVRASAEEILRVCAADSACDAHRSRHRLRGTSAFGSAADRYGRTSPVASSIPSRSTVQTSEIPRGMLFRASVSERPSLLKAIKPLASLLFGPRSASRPDSLSAQCGGHCRAPRWRLSIGCPMHRERLQGALRGREHDRVDQTADRFGRLAARVGCSSASASRVTFSQCGSVTRERVIHLRCRPF